jgi:hypothetical protein
MEHWHKFVSRYLWIAPHVFLVAVPVAMYVRRLHKTFPLFFFYTLYEICQFLVLFGIYLLAPTQAILYQYVFVVALAGSAALRFGVVQEVFNHVFHDYPRLETNAADAMRWLTGLLLASGILTAIYSSGAAPDHLLAGVALLDRSVAIIQAGMLIFLFFSARMFGLSSASFAFGIALGFGLLAATDLAVWALRLSGSDLPLVKLLNLLLTGGFHISVLVWLGYLLAVERPVNAASYAVPELEQWSGELGRSQ